MRMNGGALFFSAIGLAAALILLIYDERRRQHELLAMERMRGSMLYYDLYPLVAYARQHNLDRVQVERSRVVFYGVCPPGRMGEFVLAERGYRPLNARRTLALAQVLAEDIPVLRSGACYRLRRYAVQRPNGRRDNGYQYVICSRYKTALMYERQWAPLD